MLRFGNLIVYAPVAILWPLSYFGSPAMSSLYLKVHSFLSRIGTFVHLTVLIMFWWSTRMYLYETNLAYQTIEIEAVAYFFATFVFFRMIGWELHPHFH